MSEFSDIRVDRPDPEIFRVVIDRPATRNAYRSLTCRELHTAIEDFRRDDDARVLVLTGEGRNFCSGGDISDNADIEEARARQFGHGAIMREGMHRVVRALWECDKPTVAMVDGPAVSGGLVLALSCDFRIGGGHARMGDMSGSVGLLPDEGGAWLFPRVLGWDRALRMVLLNEVYDADRALELGLLTERVDSEELEAYTLDFARRLAAGAPLAQRMVKRMMRSATNLTLDQALQEAELAVEVINESHDANEGVQAFREKRRPRFIGR